MSPVRRCTIEEPSKRRRPFRGEFGLMFAMGVGSRMGPFEGFVRGPWSTRE